MQKTSIDIRHVDFISFCAYSAFLCVGFQVFVKALKRMRKVAIDLSIHCCYVSAQGARVNINLLWGASVVAPRTFCIFGLFFSNSGSPMVLV